MPTPFDPVSTREYWLNSRLESEAKFKPPPNRRGRSNVLSARLNGLVEAYLVGLADRVRPVIEKMIGWMESQPENEPRQFSKDVGHWRAGWHDLYVWRQTLGVCKWLSRGESAESHFASALEADWHSWTAVSPRDAALDRSDLESDLLCNLALALAAKTPLLGLKYLALADLKEPFPDEVPMLEFGEWACRHLAGGGQRNAAFIARGAEMLRQSPPDFFTFVRRDEAALWLKAIYWDSGVVRTPEQTIAKAYDFMPGVERPDFVAS